MGNVPDVSEALITCVTAAVTVGVMDWNRLVGTGSSGHVVGWLNVRSLDTQLSLRGVNERDAVGLLHADFVVQGSGVGSSINCFLIAATLSIKNEPKVPAVRLVAGGGGVGLSRVLKVEKSFWVSVVL